jgi:predicted lipoprotein with Yx(FWY)xxD motif
MRVRPRLMAATTAFLTVPLAVATVGMSAASATPGGQATRAATASHAASATSAVVVTTARSEFGQVLVTGSGMSLYVFSGDDLPFSTSGPQLNCTALNKAPNGTPCTVAWPPLLATGQVIAKGGVRQKGLGTVTRNGVTQVTYFGHPLYGFILDKAPGQMNGEDVAAFNGMWYLDHTDGRPAVGVPTVQTEVSSLGIVLSSPTASGVRTQYLLTADAPNMTACTPAGGCTAFWPPLLTPGPRAMTGPGVGREDIGTIRRPDGTFQVTFHGHPLYFFAFDLGLFANAGLTNGEYLLDPAPVNGVWYTVLPNGTPNPGTTTVGSESVSGKDILSITAGLTHVTATLYAFSADTRATSQCIGKCAVIWPPVITATPSAVTGGANAALLGVIPRADGTFQVTYNGHPLYFFALGLNNGTSGAGITAFGGTFNTVTTAGSVG